MLTQNSDGFIDLLPALPDVWKSGGSIKGLRARGEFEILNMEWKDGKIIKTVIRSTIGGNLRLRIPNEMKFTNGIVPTIAKGENSNTFYQTEQTADPIISNKAVITLPVLNKTFVYDIRTKDSQIITLVAKQ